MKLKQNAVLILEKPQRVSGAIWPRSPHQRWYVCNRCGSIYQSMWGCGCAIQYLLEKESHRSSGDGSKGGA